MVGGIRSIKTADFDDKIDIFLYLIQLYFLCLNVLRWHRHNYNLAQAAPQMHNMYEAYRRMYQAMGVQNIDAILPVPTPPQPQDPGIENGSTLLGKPLQAFRRTKSFSTY